MKEKIIINYIKKAKILIFFFIIVTFIYSGINFIFPWIYKYIYDLYLPTLDNRIFYHIIIAIIILMFATMIFNFLNNILSTKIKLKFKESIRYDLLDRLLHYKFNYYQETKSGDIISNLIPEIDITSDVLLRICKTIIFLIQIIIFFVILFFIDNIVGITFSIIFVISSIWTYILKKHIIDYGIKLTKIREIFYSFFYSSFHSIKEIKYYNLYDLQKKNLHNISLKNKKVSIISFTINALLKITSLLPLYLGNIVIIIIGFYKIKSGDYTFGLFITILIFTGYIINPLKEIIDSISIIQKGWASIKKLSQAYSYETEFQNGIEIKNINNSIKLKNLCFSYNNNISVLKNINFKFYKNKFITIVGESGSGKSTIINLILKLYQINNNQIKIDKNDLANINTNNIREKIGIVSQDGFILNDSLKNNIDLNRTLTDNEIINLCKDVDLIELLKKLPDGIYSELAEQGKNLSGGEKQRILLARCLAKKSNVIILDEATSAMDLKTEKNIINILQNYRKKQKNFFIIAIAHRPSFTQYSDIICTLENGKIKETGSHLDLIKLKGKYFSMFKEKDQY